MIVSSTLRSPHAETVVVWLAPDGRIELVSGATDELLGLESTALQRDFVWSFFEELNEADYQDWWSHVRDAESLEQHWTLRTAAGPRLRLRMRARFIDRVDQQFIRCTLEPSSEELVGISLPRWGLLQSKGGAAQWKISTGELLVTEALKRLLGLPGDEALPPQTTFFGLLQPHCEPNDLRRLIAVVREVQRDGKPGELTVAAHLEQHPHTRLRVYCAPHTGAGAVDTLRLWVQVASTDEYAHADKLYEGLPTLIMGLREDGEIAWGNAAARRLLLLGDAPSAYPSVGELGTDSLADEWDAQVERVRARGVVSSEDSALRRSDGKLLPARIQLFHQRGNSQVPVLLVAEDRTHVHRIELELADARLRANAPERTRRTDLDDTELGVQIVYRSDEYRELMRQIRTVGPTDSTVLILGETGTGKELLARAIHEYSSRRSQALIKVNCAALPETLAESELFGHEKGAFTGAYARQIGKFEQADGGTLFLDEVGELSLNVQAKLLRVLQEGEIERIGGEGVRRVDVRVVAATNRDLRARVDQGAFRSDLYFRLNVFPVVNPPLRERTDDILPLAQHLLRKHAQRLNREVDRIGKQAQQRLLQYAFPGNVRELENIIERGIILARTNVLRLEHWNHEAPLLTGGRGAELPTFEDGQRILIDRALQRTRGRVSGPGGAAELLALNPQTLYSKMRKLGIDRDDY